MGALWQLISNGWYDLPKGTRFSLRNDDTNTVDGLGSDANTDNTAGKVFSIAPVAKENVRLAA